MKKLMLSMAVVMGLAACAGAVLLPIANPSFEAQTLADGIFIVDDVTGWVVEDAAAADVWIYNPNTETPDGTGSDGENVLMLWHSMGIKQTLAGAATDNTHYRFSMDIFVGGSYTGNEIFIGIGDVLVQSNDQSWEAGDSMVPIQLHGIGISNLQNTSPSVTDPDTSDDRTNFTSGDTGGWHTLVLEWDVPAGSALDGEDITIYLRKHPLAAGGWTMMDNVSLDAIDFSDPDSEILEFSKVPGSDFMEMVINVSRSDLSAYSPEACADLVYGEWTNVAHSFTNDVATLAFTNLEYSAVDGTGTNMVIYLQADNVNKFFQIVGNVQNGTYGQNGTWVVDADGSWWDAFNWLDGDVAFGAGSTASFDTVDITTNRNVIVFPVTVGVLNFADAAAPTYGWTLSGDKLTLVGSSTPVVNVAGADDVATITAELIGSQGFNKTGNGTLYLSQSENTGLIGAINVKAGTLKTEASHSTGFNNVTVASGAEVELIVPPNGNTGSTGDWTINGSGIGGGGVLRYVSVGVSMAFNYPLTLGSGSTIGVDDSGATLLLQSSLSGSSDLTKVGDGLLKMLVDNGSSYTGDTTISAGTVRMDHVNALGAFDTGGTITVADGATLKWNYPAQESDRLLVINGSGVDGTGVLKLVREDGAGARVIGWTGVDIATDSLVNVEGANCGMYLGGLVGFGDLTKIGAYKLDLERENELYAGAIMIEEGPLSIRHFSSALGLATAGTTLYDGTKLELVSDGHTGSDGQNYDGHNYPEPFIFGGGSGSSGVEVIRYDSSGNAVTDELSGAITLATDVAISVIDVLGSSDDELRISGAIGGAGDITITGDIDGGGVIELSGNNTFVGNATVNSGTLRLTGTNNKLPDTGTLTIASGATVDLGSGVGETVNSLVLNGVVQSAGTYNAANTPSFFSGAGNLIVTP